MKTKISCLFLSLTLFATISAAEFNGRVTLVANIDANNENSDMRISVIDLQTKEVIQRDEVSTRFFSSLSINGRYIVYFKKAGHPAMRMIVDTHTLTEANYCIRFSLNLKDLGPSLETGISISVGTLMFDATKSGFVLKPSLNVNCNRVALTSCDIENGVVKF